MQCEKCRKEYERWIKGKIENHLCPDCNDSEWARWEIEQADNLKEIERLKIKGHSQHCACRIVWGDGECTCDMEKAGYDPYWWTKLYKQ